MYLTLPENSGRIHVATFGGGTAGSRYAGDMHKYDPSPETREMIYDATGLKLPAAGRIFEVDAHIAASDDGGSSGDLLQYETNRAKKEGYESDYTQYSPIAVGDIRQY